MRSRAGGALTGESERGLSKPLQCQGLSCYCAGIGLCDRTNKRENRQSIHSQRDESLDKALRRGADAGAHTNSLVSRFVPSVVACARPNFNAQVLGMVLELHLPEDWDLGADPFRKLRESQVPMLDPVTLLVV